ncbi:hypothetical protein H0H81_009476 [Sphagnurus paluster]|uniref:Protein kinase domain-containing protein n=1 Tax=Sphagnurus paluster TaxID=117069 RepID=A0A9P7KIS2_9AGAR|nr:hypothetical protein H0H81_009476 [Sphagnurus paluster]
MYDHLLRCDSPSLMLFGDRTYSLPTRDALVAFFNEWCHVPRDAPPRRRFTTDAPLVLTHNDLYPRNIILGDGGRVWMIDFGESEFYPPWFEYFSMVGVANNCLQPPEMSW